MVLYLRIEKRHSLSILQLLQDVIRGLKHNWEEYHHQYQSLSVMVDTIPKRNRKEFLENEMKKLEKDIEILEKHDIIYIGN